MVVRMVKKEQKNGSLLSGLKIVKDVERKALSDAVAKFLDSLNRQIEYVEMELKGEPLPMQGGEERSIRPRLWYWETSDGEWYVTASYGTVKMDISGDKNIVRILDLEEYKKKAQPTAYAGTTLEDVKTVLELLKEATVKTRELVPAIQHVASLISDRLTSARK